MHKRNRELNTARLAWSLMSLPVVVGTVYEYHTDKARNIDQFSNFHYQCTVKGAVCGFLVLAAGEMDQQGAYKST